MARISGKVPCTVCGGTGRHRVHTHLKCLTCKGTGIDPYRSNGGQGILPQPTSD